jgi:hypothetical protein
MSSALIGRTEGRPALWNFSFRTLGGRPPQIGTDIAKLVANRAPFLLSFHSLALTAVHVSNAWPIFTGGRARPTRARLYPMKVEKSRLCHDRCVFTSQRVNVAPLVLPFPPSRWGAAKFASRGSAGPNPTAPAKPTSHPSLAARRVQRAWRIRIRGRPPNNLIAAPPAQLQQIIRTCMPHQANLLTPGKSASPPINKSNIATSCNGRR